MIAANVYTYTLMVPGYCIYIFIGIVIAIVAFFIIRR